jgi:hypothetical protein
LTHAQLVRQRGLRGTTLGPANRGRRLDDAERQAIEQNAITCALAPGLGDIAGPVLAPLVTALPCRADISKNTVGGSVCD